MTSCCAFGDFYEFQNLMVPIHDCPAEAPEPESAVEWVSPPCRGGAHRICSGQVMGGPCECECHVVRSADPLGDYLDLTLGNPLGRAGAFPTRWR